MIINLNVRDRLVIISILPTQGKMTDMVDIIDLIKLIKFTEVEKENIHYNEGDGKIEWDIHKDINRDFDITIEQLKIIKDSVKKLDGEGNINMNIFDTCLKFSKL